MINYTNMIESFSLTNASKATLIPRALYAGVILKRGTANVEEHPEIDSD